MKKKIYIAGCGGMLGEGFNAVFKNDYELKCTDKDVNEVWLSYLDFRDYEAYKKDVFEFKPDYLFHLGAHTSLEFCDTYPDDAYLTNTIAVENAVHIANE
jgi:dTDP-4-dehydrorhamnose reductase